ncbi:MAG: 3-oxoacyl-[acyl-carrier-protein] synthase [Blastocatellia bacterium]|jgi:3-oxoacyl-[acyl-carrier-protein] synthase II|nr:3-oxoacyl-[acyl-carrier-protein] synthase [Blastocatellia bacterium]
MELEVMKRRVVVTGIGMVTPLGNTVEATWSALMAGKSGAGPITKFDTSGFPVRFACEVKDFDPLKYVVKKDARKMGAFTHYAIAASDEALADSGLKITADNAETIGTYISSGIGDFWGIEREHIKLLRGGPRAVSPFFIVSVLANMAAGQVSIRNGAKGPNSSTSTACAAGNHAIGDSFKIIQRGDAVAMICGGAESTITPMTMAGFAAMRALSTRNDEPERACRPFDRERDGFVVGEGAGIMILEELEHARQRGAHIYAEIVGYGATADAYHMTAPDETQSGVIRAMQRAMRDADASPEEIGYINAHGTSTPLGDKGETLAVKKAFGAHAYELAISSTKSMTGHLLGAAGGIEAVFTTLAIHREKLPPTINYNTPDPDCDLDYVPNEPREARVEYALTNGFGFGGTNAALVFRRFEELGK